MSFMVPLTLFGWIPAVIALFAWLPPRRAVIAAYLFAWLFLPMAGYGLPGFPDYTKISATTAGIFIATMLFDPNRLLRFRPKWFDIPALIFCTWTFGSSITNGQGAYDGLSAVVDAMITWGLPYLIGRIYFTDMEGIRELAIAIMIGGLIYVPLCLIEIRLSPQLHNWIYGYHQHQFAQTIRMGGFRPTVFMQHGLAVGMWMINTTLVAFWLYWSGAMKRFWGIPMTGIIAVLFVTTVLCKSTGALALMMLGLAAAVVGRRFTTKWPLWCLLAIPPLWMTTRTMGWFSGQWVVDLSSVISEARAQSFATRLDQENEITTLALQRPVFGGSRWWPWGADQLWILVFRNTGIPSLIALTLMFLLPVARLIWRLPGRVLYSASGGSLVCICLIVALHMIDNMMNAMINPLFTMAAGALTTLAHCLVSARAATPVSIHSLSPRRLGATHSRRRRPSPEHNSQASLLSPMHHEGA